MGAAGRTPHEGDLRSFLLEIDEDELDYLHSVLDPTDGASMFVCLLAISRSPRDSQDDGSMRSVRAARVLVR